MLPICRLTEKAIQIKYSCYSILQHHFLISWYIEELHLRCLRYNLRWPAYLHILLMFSQARGMGEHHMWKWRLLPNYKYVKSVVFTAVSLMLVLFWVMRQCSFVGWCQRFGDTHCLHLQGRSEDEDSMHLQNVSIDLQNYTGSKPESTN
jgi:hypothetical protein